MIFGFDSLVLSFVEKYFFLCAFIRSVKRFWIWGVEEAIYLALWPLRLVFLHARQMPYVYFISFSVALTVKTGQIIQSTE